MSRPHDGLVVGLLLAIVVMLAYVAFVAPARQALQTASRGGTAAPPEQGSPKALASASASSAPVQAPGDGARRVAPVPGRMGAMHLREYLAGVVALERDADLRLTRDQARALRDTMRQYGVLSAAVPAARDAIDAVLTPAQRALLEKQMPTGPPTPDPRHTAEQLLEQSIRRLLEQSAGR